MQKIILVTGASSGLGETIATHLTTIGHIVYGTSRKPAKPNPACKMLQMDVQDEQSIRQAIDAIIREQGRIDVLINNAGLGLVGPAEYLSTADLFKIIDTNVLGVLRTCQQALPYMRQQKKGLIINISSIASENGLPYRAAYSASKAAVDRITEAIRLEVAPFGIQACYVQPGGFNTAINDNRMVTQLPSGAAYTESWERTHSIIKESVATGLDPQKAAVFIEKIINSKKVKRCYRIGRPLEKLSVFLKRILPDATYDNMVSKHFQV
ncbi:MAG TPA: SDR family oxidoreductase [Chitinophaga sp.]|uniref:SDR family oxidoreductase n=1 Tax=Chitinophaga sp. TaxID=1869181 RepID=UPI002B9570C1|nr:SDR family oxidoreductase [Chitinophaga sp.]HVI43266.1 SDR family oxidoreductase [Chitinophaga sp.]